MPSVMPIMARTWAAATHARMSFSVGRTEEELKAAGLLDARSQPPIFRPEEPDLPLEPGDDGVIRAAIGRAFNPHEATGVVRHQPRGRPLHGLQIEVVHAGLVQDHVRHV